MKRAATAKVDLDALRHNLAVAQTAAAGSRVMAVVKANAYGHGLIAIAKALQHADGLAVACLDEAIRLRHAGLVQPILVLQGFHDVEQIELFAQLNLIAVVHHAEQLQMLRDSDSAAIRIWLKIDTGMGRLGFYPADVREVYQQLKRSSVVQHEVGLMSHMASADELDSPVTAQQLACFNDCTQGLAGERSLANSAALLATPESRADWVRPGLMLYGANPFVSGTAADWNLRPVMSLSSRLMAIKPICKGQRVGYAGSWTAPENTLMGLVAIGYGDGYPRQAVVGTPLLIAGKRATLIGRVSMDLLNVDLRAVPEAKVGDEVLLWGEGLPVDEVAQSSSTLAYELLCGATKNLELGRNGETGIGNESN
ncbi:MAG: alanine racemase [Gammaproteobacteria bacterium]|nr:alanine racemase [Gammaproteobacteria bacterium]